MTIYVTGSEGRLGKELVRQGCLPFICDITDPKSIRKSIMHMDVSDFQVGDVVINCAAITQVDKCQSEDQYQEAFRVNTDGVKILYGELLKMVPGVDLIHISTDYVFDGHRGPYHEHNLPITETEDGKLLSPVNGYGWSKLGAELFLQQVENTTIVRTTGLFGTGNDLWDAAIKCINSDKKMMVTDELVANQTYVPNLASNLIALCSVPTKNRPLMIHLASDDLCSRYDFVKKIITKIYGDEVAKKYIIPCRNKDIDWVAPRPTNSGLNCDFAKAFVEFGIKIITIDRGIDQCFVDRGYVGFPT